MPGIILPGICIY